MFSMGIFSFSYMAVLKDRQDRADGAWRGVCCAGRLVFALVCSEHLMYHQVMRNVS
jgi:hypothetical protein